MKIIVPLKEINIQDTPLPEGYSMRMMKDTVKDHSTWDYLQTHFRHTKFPEGEKNTAVFVFHGDEPVGCLGIIIDGSVGLMTAGVVLEEHRRRGIYKIMTMHLLRYCEKRGIETIRLGVRNHLDNFWKRILGFDERWYNT